jgi:nickel-dependent lactate racemase
MEEIAIKSGLKFIVNVVLNRRGQVADVVAGDVVAAHRAGVDIARPIYTVEIDEQPDIVIASSHPADRDLWQGIKAINNCGMLVKNAGTLILITPAFEGIAPDHQEFVELGTTPAGKVLEMVDNGQISDGVAAATYLALDQTRRRVNITIVTNGITNDQAGRMGLTTTQHFQQALGAALARHGNKAQIGVVTCGGDIMGRF